MNLDLWVPHIWLVLSATGGVLAIMSLIESVTDFLVTKPTNGFRMLAIGDIAAESIRLVMYTMFAGLGIWALINDRGRDGGAVWVLVLGVFLLVVKTVIQMLVRRYIRETHGRTIGGKALTRDQKEDLEMGEHRRDMEAHRE